MRRARTLLFSSQCEVDATVDYPSLSNLLVVDGTEDALSTPEPNWFDPHSPSLSNASRMAVTRAMNLLKRKVTDSFKPTKMRTLTFPNALCLYINQSQAV